MIIKIFLLFPWRKIPRRECTRTFPLFLLYCPLVLLNGDAGRYAFPKYCYNEKKGVRERGGKSLSNRKENIQFWDTGCDERENSLNEKLPWLERERSNPIMKEYLNQQAWRPRLLFTCQSQIFHVRFDVNPIVVLENKGPHFHFLLWKPWA